MKIGWIDFSKEQRGKVLSVLKLLAEPGAVDEIGIGIIRDSFADILFPGTLRRPPLNRQVKHKDYFDLLMIA